MMLRALMSHKADTKDPVIPQLVWLAYEKNFANVMRQAAMPEPKNAKQPPTTFPRSPETELAWLSTEAPGNEFVRDQIVPKVMRRLVATGKADDLKLCVEFVAKLKDANSREKALDGLAVALAGQTVNAPAAWAALKDEIAKENNPKLVALANKLAVSFRDPVALKRAVEIAANTGLAADARVEAVRQLAVFKAPETIAILLNMARKDEADAVRVEAVRTLAVFDSPKIPAELVAAWKEFPKTLRPEVLNTLASHKSGAKALLQAMADKKIDRAEVTDNTILRIQAHNDKELNGLIEKAWGRTRPTPAELNKLIDKTRDSLYAAPASFARGKVVFEGICAKCHKFDGKGPEVGPALDGAGRDIEYILTNVIDPNRVIGAPYFVRTVRTNDDTVFQGLLAEEDEKTLTLKLEGAAFKTIKKSDIADVRVSEKSLMPEGLGYNLTEQNFRDLVRYVMANPFLTDVTVNGSKLSVGVPGRIILPDTKGAPAVVEAEVTAPSEIKTKLLVGSTADYEVRLDGKSLGVGKGLGKNLRPDQDSFDVTLPAGKHTLAVVVKNAGTGNALHARFLDPDRKLSYPDAGNGK
jgi:putative heme-binding domain-containing protein